MRQYSSWSVVLCRWGRLHIRLHLFFLLFAAFTMFLSWSRSGKDDNVLIWVTAAGLGIVLVSVLLHELGHYFAARRFGGGAQLLVLWPLGGLCPLQPPLEPRNELAMHLAGPFVNLFLCIVSAAYVASEIGSAWLGLLNPLSPQPLMDAALDDIPLLVGKCIFWINWVLFLANLLPVFPFDGGRALRSALVSLNPEMSFRRAVFFVSGIAKIVALVLMVLAVLRWSDRSNEVLPIWFSLALLSLFVYFSAKQEEDRVDEGEIEEETFGYDFSQGYTSLERSSGTRSETVSPIRRWWDERRQARLQRKLEIEADEERRVDEILSRLHEQGMGSLSAEDRALLKRVSQRLRHRQAE